MSISTWFFSQMAAFGPPPVGTWILLTGFWNDAGTWDDTASWNG